MVNLEKTFSPPARLYVNTIGKYSNDMERGETYWIFAGDEIQSFIFDGYEINGDIYGHKDKYTRVIIMQSEITRVFPTREALCEHYRKIFE